MWAKSKIPDLFAASSAASPASTTAEASPSGSTAATKGTTTGAGGPFSGLGASKPAASGGAFGTVTPTATSTYQPFKPAVPSPLGGPALQPGQTTGGGLLGQSTAPAQPTLGLGGLSGLGSSLGLGGQMTTAAAGTSTPSKPPPFGTSMLGGAATTTTQPSSLLGGSTLAGTTTTATQPSAFGVTTTTTPAAPAMGANILSNNGLGTQAQPTAAYFDSLLTKSKKHADGEAAIEDLPSLQLGLGDLRQRLKKLGPAAQNRPLDGKAHYLLAASGVDPGAAVKDLGSFGVPASKLEKAQGAGAGELDVETYLANLQTKTTLSMIAGGLERSVRDFDSFLEDNVTMEWEAQRLRIYEHFGIKPREKSGGSFATPAKEATGGFGRSKRSRQQSGTPARSAHRASAFGRSSLHRSVIGAPGNIGPHASEFTDVEAGGDAVGSLNGVASMDDRFLREKQAKLAEKIHSFNDHRAQGAPYPILQELVEVEEKSGDRHAPQLVDAYRAMIEVVGESSEAEGTRTQTLQRKLAPDYLDPNTNSPKSIAMRRRVLTGASTYLEKQFFAELEALIAKYPLEAALGGRPDVTSKIKAFIRLRDSHKNLVQDNTPLQTVMGSNEPLWAIVFYLLRSGFVKEAIDYIEANRAAFRNYGSGFHSYLINYARSEDRRLKRQVQDQCSNQYLGFMNNSEVDPFKKACYKIVGRCDISNRSLDQIHSDVSDWVWFQFNLAREADRSAEFAGDIFDLADLQNSIREIGAKHFPKNKAGGDPNGAFGMFFYLQILAGMYEQAVAYLYSFSYVDAVHFAVALEYYGLLRAADALTAGNELLSFNTRNLPQINFARMLGYYTRDFRAANITAAVDYLVLICLNVDDVERDADRGQAEICYEALRELVLETREFSKLIGDIRPDGKRILGVIENRRSLIALQHEREFMREITVQAAHAAETSGRTTDAVLLYHLAGDYDNVVVIVSRALSEAVALEIGEEPLRLIPVKPRVDPKQQGAGGENEAGSSLSLAVIDDPIELAQTMMTMYERDQMFRSAIREENRVACALLLQMSHIKSKVGAGEWMQAFEIIKRLEILPLGASGDPSKIREYAGKFASLAPSVAVNVPNLLMWTVTCCAAQRERITTTGFTANPHTAAQMMAQLKQVSVDLTTYTSQLRYRFPPHLHEALARATAD